MTLAKKQLDECTQPRCLYCVDSVCCFGYRDLGCAFLDPTLLHKIRHIPDIMIAAYSAFIHPVTDGEINYYHYDPDTINEIERGVTELITPVNVIANGAKTRCFVYKGLQFNPRDNAMDQSVCPYCHAELHNIKNPESYEGFIGYKQFDIDEFAACFECTKCFGKFFYHVNKEWIKKCQ